MRRWRLICNSARRCFRRLPVGALGQPDGQGARHYGWISLRLPNEVCLWVLLLTQGDYDAVRTLLDGEHVDVHRRDADGASCLMFAAMRGHAVRDNSRT
jgi:hypothetical protein